MSPDRRKFVHRTRGSYNPFSHPDTRVSFVQEKRGGSPWIPIGGAILAASVAAALMNGEAPQQQTTPGNRGSLPAGTSPAPEGQPVITLIPTTTTSEGSTDGTLCKTTGDFPDISDFDCVDEMDPQKKRVHVTVALLHDGTGRRRLTASYKGTDTTRIISAEEWAGDVPEPEVIIAPDGCYVNVEGRQQGTLIVKIKC